MVVNGARGEVLEAMSPFAWGTLTQGTLSYILGLLGLLSG